MMIPTCLAGIGAWDAEEGTTPGAAMVIALLLVGADWALGWGRVCCVQFRAVSGRDQTPTQHDERDRHQAERCQKLRPEELLRQDVEHSLDSIRKDRAASQTKMPTAHSAPHAAPVQASVTGRAPGGWIGVVSSVPSVSINSEIDTGPTPDPTRGVGARTGRPSRAGRWASRPSSAGRRSSQIQQQRR